MVKFLGPFFQKAALFGQYQMLPKISRLGLSYLQAYGETILMQSLSPTFSVLFEGFIFYIT